MVKNFTKNILNYPPEIANIIQSHGKQSPAKEKTRKRFWAKAAAQMQSISALPRDYHRRGKRKCQYYQYFRRVCSGSISRTNRTIRDFYPTHGWDRRVRC